jgi:hypothetical protein
LITAYTLSVNISIIGFDVFFFYNAGCAVLISSCFDRMSNLRSF